MTNTHSNAEAHLRPVEEIHSQGSPARKVDLPRAELAVAELLESLGFDTQSPQLAQTPKRVALSLKELTGGQIEPMSTFANEDGVLGPIMVRDIAFISLCEHHLLPFQGKVHIAYLPNELIGGFSGFAHAVDMFAHTLGLQESLTINIAKYLEQELQPRAVGVMIEAQHMCMAARGVRAREAGIVTLELLGAEADTPAFQALFAMSATTSGDR